MRSYRLKGITWKARRGAEASDWRSGRYGRIILISKRASITGARIIEAYPLTPEGTKSQRYELHMGLVSTFEEAGFHEAVRPSKRRPAIRYYVHADQA